LNPYAGAMLGQPLGQQPMMGGQMAPPPGMGAFNFGGGVGGAAHAAPSYSFGSSPPIFGNAAGTSPTSTRPANAYESMFGPVGATTTRPTPQPDAPAANANAAADGPGPGPVGGGGGVAESSRPQRPKIPIPSEPPFTAFVGNFPYECPQDEVVGLFVNDGCDVADVRVVRNRDTDRPRGYFIEFKDVESLKKALVFDARDLGGRPLRVNVAEGRPEGRGDRRDRHGGFADRYNERDGGGRDRRGLGEGRSGGGFAESYNRGDRGDARGGGGSFGRREGGGGYQEAHGGGRDRRRSEDVVGSPPGGGARNFTGGGYHAPRGGGGRESFGRDRPAPSPPDPNAPPPPERKKLQLKPRSADADKLAAEPATAAPSSKSNPFGAAKPVDSTAKIAEAEKKIKEYHDEVNAKAGIVKLAPGQLPAPKPIAKEIAAGFIPANSNSNSNSNAAHGAKREAKGPVIHVPEEKTIEASNVFSLLSMDDDDGDDEEE
jgi:translation initiation factor 4B